VLASGQMASGVRRVRVKLPEVVVDVDEDAAELVDRAVDVADRARSSGLLDAAVALGRSLGRVVKRARATRRPR
jgi:hypothetical protein